MRARGDAVEPSAQRLEEGRRDRVRRVWRRPDSHVRRRRRVAHALGGLFNHGRRFTAPESQQLKENRGRERRSIQQRHGYQRVADIANGCRTSRLHRGDRVPRGVHDLRRGRVRLCAPERHDLAYPVSEPRGGRDRARQIRQLDVRVGIDEPRHQRHTSEIAFVPASAVHDAVSHVRDAIIRNVNPSIVERRR